MSTVQSITSTTNTNSSKTTLSKNMLDQDDFLRMMLAQIKSQDPTKPVDGQQYLGQLAQFSTLSSIQQLQQSFDKLAQSLMSIQTGQATQLVGKQVLVETDRGYYTPGQNLEGEITVPDRISNLTLKVYSTNGQLVNTVNMGAQAAGQVRFSLGNGLSTGTYKVIATGMIDGKNQQFATQIWNRVESVSVSQNGLSSGLQLVGGIGNVQMGAVRAIR